MKHREQAVDPSLPIVANRLKSFRLQKGWSQAELAARAGITRQAISAIEANQYLPVTGVALQLASALDCRVEDLFSLVKREETIVGPLIGRLQQSDDTASRARVKVSIVGRRVIVRPVQDMGELFPYVISADGYATVPGPSSGASVRVTLARDRQAIEREIWVAGCDPAVFLVGDYLHRQKDSSSVIGWNMGSRAALNALKRREVHVAGIHLYDPVTGESNVPFVRRWLKDSGYHLVTFASWEEGFLVRPGNPKSIRTVADLANPDVTLVNREEGSGARLLLDQRLRAAAIAPTLIRGYDHIVGSHFEVARAVAAHQADAGIGIRSAARHFGLDFIPLQTTRYDLVVPTPFFTSHPTLMRLFDTLTAKAFRQELAALGGYDTRETGKLQCLRPTSR
ncbi:MAG: helix-turn-helix domain-containing protein [Nitrospira sp.]|nr:helix-turn-helix domain-containing protein [Nitrospira sp.]